MSELTLPGDIEGLLRRGSPVVFEGTQMTIAERPTLRYAIGVGETNDDLGPHWVERLHSEFALDLTDATGRAHAAWWLEGKGHKAPLLAHLVTYPRSKWVGIVRAGDWYGVPNDDGRLSVWSNSCPALATIDPNDPRLLEDGSRWVDAEALRLVCLHVAGRGAT